MEKKQTSESRSGKSSWGLNTPSEKKSSKPQVSPVAAAKLLSAAMADKRSSISTTKTAIHGTKHLPADSAVLNDIAASTSGARGKGREAAPTTVTHARKSPSTIARPVDPHTDRSHSWVVGKPPTYDKFLEPRGFEKPKPAPQTTVAAKQRAQEFRDFSTTDQPRGDNSIVAQGNLVAEYIGEILSVTGDTAHAILEAENGSEMAVGFHASRLKAIGVECGGHFRYKVYELGATSASVFEPIRPVQLTDQELKLRHEEHVRLMDGMPRPEPNEHT